MDPSAIIVAALTSGVAAVARGTATAAVLDAYRGLRSALITRLPDKEATSVLFDEVEREPERADILVHQILRHERARIDDELYQRARDLLEILPDSGAGQSSYRVDITQARGVQVGDHNMQTNTFFGGEVQPR
jgi:hypothetical protein